MAHSRAKRPRSFWSAPRIETSGTLNTGGQRLMDTLSILRMLKNWERPEFSILGADQKDHGLRRRECSTAQVVEAQREWVCAARQMAPSVYICERLSHALLSYLPASQCVPVNPAGHKHWKMFGVKERQVALFWHGLVEQPFLKRDNEKEEKGSRSNELF